MLDIERGSYVTHAKLPELGSGEILSVEKGTIRIRFASGERAFQWEFASSHLTVTQKAPPPPTKTKAKAKKSKAVAQ